MAEEWLYLQHPKTGVRVAVLAENYADKHAAGYRLDPDYGGQEAPKAAKAADDKPAKKDGE